MTSPSGGPSRACLEHLTHLNYGPVGPSGTAGARHSPECQPGRWPRLPRPRPRDPFFRPGPLGRPPWRRPAALAAGTCPRLPVQPPGQTAAGRGNLTAAVREAPRGHSAPVSAGTALGVGAGGAAPPGGLGERPARPPPAPPAARTGGCCGEPGRGPTPRSRAPPRPQDRGGLGPSHSGADPGRGRALRRLCRRGRHGDAERCIFNSGLGVARPLSTPASALVRDAPRRPPSASPDLPGRPKLDLGAPRSRFSAPGRTQGPSLRVHARCQTGPKQPQRSVPGPRCPRGARGSTRRWSL